MIKKEQYKQNAKTGNKENFSKLVDDLTEMLIDTYEKLDKAELESEKIQLENEVYELQFWIMRFTTKYIKGLRQNNQNNQNEKQ